ncbi:glycyl-tRNA synthetase beta chain [Ketogulonicigenium robustum]|uniref:Glycine--tRNA ligase beta subunit n=1 Tax=Ketogulonicigenium robustum TaxID=92947 RepID=A0A1W6P0T4_9RHOB|nr:glycine--tRNA ligase subunit beta [Ketogulonicigenium robustum]ARO15011.1 glycyl-tRNA synthetase beta chain [Ketogulonicigenium robustum]
MADLLIEIFSEEIPARMQTRAAEDLRRLVTDGLVDAGLTYEGAAAFSTPRRLVLTLSGLTAESRAVREERKGPRVGAPDAAVQGFLRASGLALEQLEVRAEKGAEVYYAVTEKPGRAAPAIIAEVLENAIRTFPWPKAMRWGSGNLRWVRPLHSIICLFDGQSVALDIDGIVASNTTRGHRFMAPGAITVTGFDDYEAKLKAAHVMLRADERAATIWHDATQAAFAQGLEVVEDKGLLAEVAGLVEWPVVLMGPIGAAFLGLPSEVLQTSMREHQKFFSVRNPATGRIEAFITVANILTADEGATILKGNGKVLSARLSDARFFWENDLRVIERTGMEGMGAGLAQVTFHNRLGSQAARIARIEALATALAPVVGADAGEAALAARVAKVDLRSEMVGEFPELQGTMGGYYARAAGLPDAVANACKGHYQPLGPDDAVPSEPVSVAVALADKLDTLTGFWAMDEKPTGSKDPFALRRAALGVIRLVLVNGLRLPLLHTLQAPLAANYAALGTQGDATATAESLLSFFHDRLKVFLKDEGLSHDVIDACLAMPGNDDLDLLVRRARALQAFMKTDDGENLVQGFKRANNILTQAEAKDGVEYSFGADPAFAEVDSEKALFAALDAAEAPIALAMQAEDFAAAMQAMAALRAPIDAFFAAVQVNSDNTVVRRNRLNLLSRIRTICLGVADLTRLAG